MGIEGEGPGYATAKGTMKNEVQCADAGQLETLDLAFDDPGEMRLDALRG